MPFQIIRGDITKMKVDAIVNAADPTLLGGGGVDGAIHKAAGEELIEACRTMYPQGCQTGDAKITFAYHLPSQYVIHTVGPIWHGGKQGERGFLASCYKKSLALAVEYDCHSIAFPLISSGAFRYPKEEALQVAIDTIKDFLKHHDMDVYLVIFQKSDYEIDPALQADISSYLKHTWIEAKKDSFTSIEGQLDHLARKLERLYLSQTEPEPEEELLLLCEEPMVDLGASSVASEESEQEKAEKLEERIDDLVDSTPAIQKRIKGYPQYDSFIDSSGKEITYEVEESFAHMVFRKIDEKGMTDPECYKKANLDRKLFSKIRSYDDYHPSRATALALGIALELSLSELQELLGKAGYALTHARKGDVIVEYFVKKGIYDIYKINQVLFSFGEPLI